MATFETILVPVDYSENASAALSTAIKLAADLGASIRVAQVCSSSAVREAIKAGLLAPGDDDATVERKVEEANAKKMDAFLAGFGDAALGLERVYLNGKPGNEIVRYAREHGVDLIVMGRRGVTVADVMLGSVAEGVVRHAHCPVMIVKRPRE